MTEIPLSQANHMANPPSPSHISVVSRHERAVVEQGSGVIRSIVECHFQPADQIEGTLRKRSSVHLLESILDENRKEPRRQLRFPSTQDIAHLVHPE